MTIKRQNYIYGSCNKLKILHYVSTWNLKKWMKLFMHALILVLNIELLVLMTRSAGNFQVNPQLKTLSYSFKIELKFGFLGLTI